MKIILSAFVLSALLLLSACTPQTSCDIHEFLKLINMSADSSGCFEDMIITKDGEMIRYSYVSDDILFCFYSGTDGIIVRCTAASLKKSEKLVSEFSNVCKVFTKSDTKKTRALLESAQKNGKAVSENYCLAFIENQAGCTFILSRRTDEINTNEYPTLKKHIGKEDISRPTLGNEEKNPKSN